MHATNAKRPLIFYDFSEIFQFGKFDFIYSLSNFVQFVTIRTSRLSQFSKSYLPSCYLLGGFQFNPKFSKILFVRKANKLEFVNKKINARQTKTKRAMLDKLNKYGVVGKGFPKQTCSVLGASLFFGGGII